MTNIPEARALLDELARRPSKETWTWIRTVIEETPEESLDALVEHAEAALVTWPDELRSGSGDSDRMLSWRERSAREWPRSSPLWRLVRTLTVESLHSVSDLPDTPLVGLDLPYQAEILDRILAWPAVGQLQQLHLRNWEAAPDGALRRLLEALDPAVVTRIGAEHLGARSVELHEVLGGRQWPALHDLTLEGLSDDGLPTLLATLRDVPLTRLQLDQRGLSTESLANLLRELPALTTLQLRRAITPQSARTVGESCSRLESLTCDLEQGSLVALCQHASAQRLQRLMVGGYAAQSPAEASEWQALAQWEGASALRCLEVSALPMHDAGASALASSHQLGALEELSLFDCEIVGAGLEAWAARDPEQTSVRELRLRDNFELRGASLASFCESEVAAKLVCLQAHDAAPRDAELERITASPHLRGLRALDLTGTGFGKKTLGRFLQSAAVEGLEALTLSYPKDRRRRLKDADAFAEAPGLSRLRRLALAGHKLWEQGVVDSFAASPHLGRLEQLDLRDNQSDSAWDESDVQEARTKGLARIRQIDVGAEV